MKLESFDKNARRIVNDSGDVVFLVLRFTNDLWCVFDLNEKRVSPWFDTAKKSFKWAEENLA